MVCVVAIRRAAALRQVIMAVQPINFKRNGPSQGVTRGDTAAQILHHAELLFAEVGFAGTSLDMIAQAVGIRRPSVLHHFGSKRALYDHVENDFFTALLREGNQRATEGPAFSRLINLLTVWLDYMIARPTAARIIMRNTADLVSRAGDPVQFSEGVVAQFEGLVLAGQASGEFRSGDPRFILNILGSSILHYVCNASQFGVHRRYNSAAHAEEFRQMLKCTASALLMPC